MEKIYSQIIDKFFNKIHDPTIKKELNHELYDIIKPTIKNIYSKVKYYLMIIIILYIVIILLLLFVIYLIRRH